MYRQTIRLELFLILARWRSGIWNWEHRADVYSNCLNSVMTVWPSCNSSLYILTSQQLWPMCGSYQPLTCIYGCCSSCIDVDSGVQWFKTKHSLSGLTSKLTKFGWYVSTVLGVLAINSQIISLIFFTTKKNSKSFYFSVKDLHTFNKTTYKKFIWKKLQQFHCRARAKMR